MSGLVSTPRPPPAGDRLPEAMDAARHVAERLGLPTGPLSVLQGSSNLVVRAHDVVLKVGTDHERLRREVALAAVVAQRGGPVLRPLSEPVGAGDFLVTAWPYVRPDPRPATEERAARALRDLHRALAGAPGGMPRLADRFAEVRRLLDDEERTAALAREDRAVLRAALDSLADALGPEGTVLHTEPHDGNRLTVGGDVRYIDLEAACVGPLEWDAAYFSDEVAERVWPDHDRRRRLRLRVGVSACVSAFCWRHCTARPDDEEMRWHARHHLEVVRTTLPAG